MEYKNSAFVLRDGVYGVDIPKNVWHKLEAIESSVIFECKEGPYSNVNDNQNLNYFQF